MISMTDLSLISLDFRRVSSYLLNTDYEQAEVALNRFYKYINETSWIFALLEPIINESNYDFRKCFMPNDHSDEFRIPLDEKDHIKAQYEYMRYIIEADKVIAIQEISKEYQRQKTNRRSQRDGSSKKPQQQLEQARVKT